MEPIKQLSKERRNWKGAMTRGINGLQQALKKGPEINVDIVKELFDKVSSNFEKIEAVHSKLIDLVDDEETFDKEEMWMEDVQATFISVRLMVECEVYQQSNDSAGNVGNETHDIDVSHNSNHNGNNSISGNIVSSDSENSSVNDIVVPGNLNPDVSGLETTSSVSSRLSNFNEIKLALELPKPEFLKFNGNPLEYFSFITNFETVIESKLSCNATRLQHLKTMCVGKARSHIECCDLLGAAGYDEAKKILRTQFGQPFMILSALMRELTDRRPIKSNDSDALWSLIASMKKCHITLTKLGYTHDLDSTGNILRIQDLLPHHLQTSWAKHAHGIITKDAREPKFIDLLDFLVLRAEVSSTMFGQNLEKPKSERQGLAKFSAQVKTNNISTEKVTKNLKCFVCGGDHQVYVCKQFLDADYKRRIELAAERKLCFRCLLTGHVAAICRRNWKCHCGSTKHHNLLHPPRENYVTTCALSSGTKVFMRVLPVTVTNSNTGRQVSTFALLDDGSDTSLCSEGLMNRLRARGKRHTFTSSTINGSKQCEGWAFNLDVQGKYESDIINLELLSVKDIPASVESRPSSKEINKWKHLQSIPWEDYPHHKNVELLIAADHPKAFWVKDKRQGEENEPYAVRTPLGWSIMGPGAQKSDAKCLFNRVQVSNRKLLDEVQQSWAVETSGLVDVQDCVEDARARDIMNSTITRVDGHYEMGLLRKHDDKTCWPATRTFECSPSDIEIKKEVMVAQATVETETNEDHVFTNLTSRYSSWTRLIRVVAWISRFVKNMKAKIINQQKTTGNLLVQELMESEAAILANEQRRFLSHWKTDKTMRQLNVVLMGNLLRVGGRLQNSQIDLQSKHPVLLPGKSNVTQLITRHHHTLVGHSGVNATLISIQSRFHIIKGKCIVKNIIKGCVTCKKLNARPVEQIMAPLPAERVTADQPPFTNTGVDYFGPIDVKQGRSMVKRYGCMFTCLASRAVHLEVAESLDADSFINAFRRFVARRGQPLKMFSDNGTNFVAGERELREALRNMNQSTIEDALHTRGCQWHFNPPAASHFGGAWERLIRSIRKILHGVLRQQTLTTEVLFTLLTEVESILNSRPLTDLPFDPNEEPLTPNHLLLMRNCPDAPIGKVESFGKRRWLQVQYLASPFWSRWKREYLPLLQRRHKWNTPRENVAVNDIVLLVDEMLPRGRWPMGKVVSVYHSKDNRVRSVDVKALNGVLKRPVSKLCIVYRGSIIEGSKC